MTNATHQPFRVGEHEFAWDSDSISPDYSAKARTGSYEAVLDIHRDGESGPFGGAVFVFLSGPDPAGSKAVRARVIPRVEPTVEQAAQALIEVLTAVFKELRV